MYTCTYVHINICVCTYTHIYVRLFIYISISRGVTCCCIYNHCIYICDLRIYIYTFNDHSRYICELRMCTLAHLGYTYRESLFVAAFITTPYVCESYAYIQAHIWDDYIASRG